MQLTGFTIIDVLHKSPAVLLLRGQRNGDAGTLLLKTATRTNPPESLTALLKHEHAVTGQLDIANISKPVGFETIDRRPLLLLEDPGGITLERIMDTEPVPLPLFLTLAVNLTRTVSKLHSMDIIHKNLHPCNILVNLKKRPVKTTLTGFGIAAMLPWEKPVHVPIGLLEGNLAYISPEQTGRMNRLLDYRSDFYSLGVVFYLILTGSLPFDTTDPMELTYAHLAVVPKPIHRSTRKIPEVISRMVLKLLAKSPEARYQSAHGLLADLEKCRDMLESTGSVTDFEIAKKDFSDQLRIPLKLFGRAKELEELMQAYGRARRGPTELVLLSGYAGIGKTSLVNEIHKPVLESRGYFISGKCDQFIRNEPLALFIEAFSNWVRQILMESDSHITQFKERLLTALGTNGRIMINVIPKLELIIGPQPPVPKMPPAESRDRFYLVFRQFVRTAAVPDHPLVLFLDDLQWIDTPSLKMIEAIMTESAIEGLLVIGAFRDNEVDEAHPLTHTRSELQRTEARISSICLGPISPSHINRLLAETLQSSRGHTQALAELCSRKTAGNPFFLKELLYSLAAQKLISFEDHQRMWQWDLWKIRKADVTSNVVALMAENIRKLENRAREILKLAACIGNRFDLQTLAHVYGKTPEKTLTALQPALEKGYVLPLSGIRYRMSGSGDESGNPTVSLSEDSASIHFQFLHDRVQEGAYDLMEERQKQTMHLKIGRKILQYTPPHKKNEKVFEIVNQFNKGRQLLAGQTEQDELAELNLMAGEKARAMAAYESSYAYFETGITLLDDGWGRRYSLAADLHNKVVEAAFLVGRYEEMEYFFRIIDVRIPESADKADAALSRIQGLTAQNRLAEALRTSLKLLNQFGLEIPENPTTETVREEYTKTRNAVNSLSMKDLNDLPEAEDRNILTSTLILSEAVMPGYFVNKQVLDVVVFKGVRLALEHGITDATPFIFGVYAAILCGNYSDIPLGYQMGRLSVRLLDRFDTEAFVCRTITAYNTAVRQFKEHLAETLSPLEQAFQIGMETGELPFSAHSAYEYCNHCFFVGMNLKRVEKKLKYYREEIRKIKQDNVLYHISIFLQAVLNLRGDCEHPTDLKGEFYDEQTSLSEHEKTRDRNALAYFHINKLILAYVFEDFPLAQIQAALAEKHLDNVTGESVVPVFCFYDSLQRLAAPDIVSPDGPLQASLAKMHANLEQLQIYAKHAPENYLHKFHLVEAERMRVAGDVRAAMENYDSAIVLAGKNGYTQEEALANELQAKFWTSMGKDDVAGIYFRKALDGYHRWGAARKVRDLKEKYPGFFPEKAPEQQAALLEIPAAAELPSLDFATVLKASQAISGEISWDRLVDKLLEIVMSNVGAGHGILLLKQAGDMVIEAESKDGRKIDRPAVAVNKENAPDRLPWPIVRYVQRTLEPVVMDDAGADTRFSTDPYITKNRSQSVLCAPIILKQRCLGILYLENNLTDGAFTADRLKIMDILSSQIAISLENARLFEKRHIAEEALSAEKEQLSVTLKSIGDGVITTNVHGRVVLLNQVAEALTGWSQDEAFGKPLPDVFHIISEETRERWVDPVEKVLESGGIVALANHTQLISRDGTHRAIADSGAPIRNTSGQIIGVVLVFRDVTEKNLLEAQLQQSQKLEAVGTLAGGIAHDFNNILGGIMGYTELAQLNTPKGSNIQDHLSNVLKAGNRAKDLVRQILSASRQTEKLRQKVSLAPIVKEALKLLRASLPAFIEIQIDIEEDRCTVLADPSQIHQVLMNLCTNAHHAMSEKGGILSVSLTSKDIDADTLKRRPELRANLIPGPHTVLMLSDTGCGMDRNTMARIFDPYFTTKEKDLGTGLGLSMVHRIVQGHGGAIRVESTPGSGTRFTVFLPLAASDTTCASVTPDNPASQGNERILMVDDEQMLTEISTSILESKGYSVTSFNCPLELLARFSEEPEQWDLIITDMTMPKMAGDALVVEIKKIRPELPVILCTGFRGQITSETFAGTEIQAIIEKPHSFEELTRTVRHVINDSRRMLNPEG